MNHLYTKVAFLNSVGDGLSKIAPNERQNAAHGTGNGVPKHLFFPLYPSILPPILIINSRRACTIMCSITVKLSEYVSGLKSIFGQQWHFNPCTQHVFACASYAPRHHSTLHSRVAKEARVSIYLTAAYMSVENQQSGF
jgi:hypothetical protein